MDGCGKYSGGILCKLGSEVEALVEESVVKGHEGYQLNLFGPAANCQAWSRKVDWTLRLWQPW